VELAEAAALRLLNAVEMGAENPSVLGQVGLKNSLRLVDMLS